VDIIKRGGPAEPFDLRLLSCQMLHEGMAAKIGGGAGQGQGQAQGQGQGQENAAGSSQGGKARQVKRARKGKAAA
jgi:hypothetical protein